MSLNWGGGSHISFTWTAGDVLVLPMAAVTHTVTDEVRTDADVGVTLKAASTAESLSVLESRDDEREAVVGGAPAVCVVAECHVVGPGDDEPIAAHRAGLRVAGYVSLEQGKVASDDSVTDF